MTHEEKELATKITYMLLEAQRGDPNGGKAYQITKMFEDYKRIVSKAIASAEKKGLEEGIRREQDFIALHQHALCFVDLKPEHPFYESIRLDLKRSIAKLMVEDSK